MQCNNAKYVKTVYNIQPVIVSSFASSQQIVLAGRLRSMLYGGCRSMLYLIGGLGYGWNEYTVSTGVTVEPGSFRKLSRAVVKEIL